MKTLGTPWMPDGKTPSIYERAPIRNHELMALLQAHADALTALRRIEVELQVEIDDFNGYPAHWLQMREIVRFAINKAEGKE
jgi:hypothetical protein